MRKWLFDTFLFRECVLRNITCRVVKGRITFPDFQTHRRTGKTMQHPIITKVINTATFWANFTFYGTLCLGIVVGFYGIVKLLEG